MCNSGKISGLIQLLICLMPLLTIAQEKYGLEFASKGMSQEARTALELFPETPLEADDEFSLVFDLSLQPHSHSYFGYVFRITDNKDQNIDLIYDVHSQLFNIVTGNEFSGISFKPDLDQMSHQWKKVRLDININKRLIKLSLDGKTIGSSLTSFTLGHQFRIFFGANHYKELKSFDLAPIRLKDVQIFQEGTLEYNWPLALNTQDIVHKRMAAVSNPIWLAQAYHEWNETQHFIIKGNASVAFDNNTGTVYINGSDSVYMIKGKTLTSDPLTQHRGLPDGNISVFDENRQQLVNFLVDEKQAALYDPAHHTWTNTTNAQRVTNYWHANSFYSRFDSAIYIFGGYGDYHYKNEVQRAGKTWETIPAKGDAFTPRYMAALGTNSKGDSAYIIGGYGSLKGDQLLNPHHLYDLILFDVKNKTFKKIYQLPEPAQPFVFGNSMIIDQQHYYALTFANDRSKSSLQLIKGSLTKPEYTQLAANIPFSFYDIKSRVNLFYDKQNEKLITTILFTENNITQVKIYTILFPPSQLAIHPAPEKIPYTWIALALFLAGAVFLSLRFKRKPQTITPVLMPITREAIIKPAILVFGEFTVTDKNGEDITKLFSPLLKELFLLLLLHSVSGKNGISSEKIYEILWADRSVKDAKNNRSVNMLKLKNILDKIADYTLVKDNGKWLLQFEEDAVDIDIQQYYQQPEDIEQLVQLTGRGTFLNGTEYAWLDKFKSEIAAEIIPLLTGYLENPSLNPEFIIDVCDSILNFDSLSEEAIMFKCRALVSLRQHSTAKAIYSNFTKEYQAIYGEVFNKDYLAVLEQ
jgi:hypothetical protein